MAWNDPGGRDPWGGNQGGGGNPPDLDEALRKLKQKLSGIFGGNSNNGGGSNNSPGGGKAPIYIGLVVLLGFWFFNGFYMVDAQERGVVLRLGQYEKTILPGLSWQPWVIDSVTIEQVTSERQYTSSGLMLTQDENIVQVPLTVQYNIKSVEDFVLKVNDPVLTLQQATDSAIRHVVGSSTLDDVLSEGRENLRVSVRERLQNYLDRYESGINIIDVTVQRGAPPEQVTEAFDDVNAAEADRDRLIDEAEAYRNRVLPEARGRAQRAIEEAQGYRGQLVSRAQGDASRFDQLLVEYTLAPQVTRQRLYLDAMESVLSNSSKVMVDTEGGNNLLYLPLDRMISSGGGASGTPNVTQEMLDEAINRLRQNQSTTTTNRSLR